MIIKSTLSFEDYSDEAFDQVLKESIGIPFFDSEGVRVGNVVKTTRVEGTKRIEFEIEMDEFQDFWKISQ